MPVTTRVDIDRARLEAIWHAIDEARRDTADDLGDIIEANAPLLTGNLVEGLYLDHDADLSSIGFRKDAFYWRFRNTGTRYQAGTHFIDTAVEALRPTFAARFTAALRTLNA